jgi:O-methyltransferase
MIIRTANKVLNKFGFKIVRKGENLPVDISNDVTFMGLFSQCRAYTMTSVERMYSLYLSLNYVIDNNVGGDFVECGVWKGGSSMLISLFLKQKGITDRKIYLYDTFEGMSEPSEMDKTSNGELASVLLKDQEKENEESIWCYSSIEEVKNNLHLTGYPLENIIFVKGKVEDTLAGNLPGKLAILRLDTDWYESTKIELELLYPLLNLNGIMIIDDFGFWEGAKRAVIEYFDKIGKTPLLHRIDFTGRLIIK